MSRKKNILIIYQFHYVLFQKEIFLKLPLHIRRNLNDCLIIMNLKFDILIKLEAN